MLLAQAAVGSYDGEHPSLTCATSAGKIFFHSPHEKDPAAQVRFLNINRKISALACGRLSSKLKRDVLLVGAQVCLPVDSLQRCGCGGRYRISSGFGEWMRRDGTG